VRGAWGLKRESVFQDLQPIAVSAGALTVLGGIAGLVAATFARIVFPTANISYGEWIAYAGAQAGLFALVVEVVAAWPPG
jgi:hypothetical protein